jgi:hypothetical protein
MSPRIAVQRGAFTTRSSSPRRIAEAQFRRRSSTNVALRSSRYRGFWRSRSSSHVTRGRTRWTAAVLRLGVVQRGICWTLAGLEQWIIGRCPSMSYTGFQPLQKRQLLQRIQDALNHAFPPGSQGMPMSRTTSEISRLGYPPNTPACHVPSSDTGRWTSSCTHGFLLKPI